MKELIEPMEVIVKSLKINLIIIIYGFGINTYRN